VIVDAEWAGGIALRPVVPGISVVVVSQGSAPAFGTAERLPAQGDLREEDAMVKTVLQLDADARGKL